MQAEKNITIRSIVFGTLTAILFAILTVYFSNRQDMTVTANQIAVLPYMLLILLVMILNPLCRLIRVVRRFSVVEIMIVLIMGSVSAGLSTFGLTEQLVPIAGSLFNQEWNTTQSEWNRYVVPFVNEKYFVSEPGIQSAADRYRRALEASLQTKSVYDTALTYQQARTKLASAAAALIQAEAAGEQDEAQKTVRVSAARLAVANARNASTPAESQWQALAARPAGISVEDILRIYPQRMDAEEQQVRQAKQALADLEDRAFEKARLFRRGLSRGLRAYPGIIPMSEDNFQSYGQRLKRAVCGRAALHELKQAQAMLSSQPASETVSRADAETIDRRLAAAVQALQPVAQSGAYERRREELSRKEDAAVGQLAELDQRLKQASGDRRIGNREAVSLARKQMATINAELKQWQSVQHEAASARERSTRQVAMARKVADVMTRIEAMRPALRKNIPVSEVRAGLGNLMQAFPAIEGSVWQYLVGDVPWSHWARPLLRWGIVIALTYIVLMSLNILIFRQWAYNEKLTYPLAELPKALVAEDGIPPVCRNPLFWMGLALSGLVLGWNVFCATQIVPGLQPFDLNNWDGWKPYVANTPFDGLRNCRSPIFFTMIGLSFLVPKNISFSLWFFYVLGMVELQMMVWGGQGVDSRSFPTDWWYLMNYSTAQGEGALLVFSTVVLYKCRKYILCAFTPSMIKDLEADERKELKIASFLFVFCSLGLILILWRSMGANLLYTLFFYLVVLIITIGLVRAVTEGGLLSFQCNGGPFHFIRSFFGLDKPWTSTSLFAPLMVYYAILFLDIKSFIAPAMANSLKLRDDFKMNRGRFHIAVILAVALAGVTGIVTAIMMSYAGGADTMQNWFYAGLPRNCMFDVIRSMTKDAPSASPSLSLWIGGGATAMAALLYFRQFIFWLPHPIGLVMFINPIMTSFWFSIFLGWLANGIATKFGNNETFRKAKGFFIGLIVGELVVVVLSMILSVILGMNVTISLNR